jgi:phenylacetate-CoA ligase
VRQFKIEQESLDLTRIFLVTDASFSADCLPGIERGAKARLGEEVKVDICLVDEIPPEKSGKYRYVVSRVDSNQAGVSL